jgi:hypothetical protein
LRDAIAESDKLVTELRDRRLGTVDMDESFLEHVVTVFSIFSSKKSMQTTGASKALHLIAPELFVMWDASIRQTYHRLHDDYSRAWSPDGRCYAKFLVTCNEIAAALETDRKQLAERHPSFIIFGFRKTLPKMIDECNFMKFFLNKQWD